MNPSGPTNSNRVKSIKSRFEVLNDQPKHVETDLSLRNSVNASQNLQKSGTCKDNVVHKIQIFKYGNDSQNSEQSSSKLFESNNKHNKEYLGASTNFGNRKRLKENDDFNKHAITESLADIKTEDRVFHLKLEESNDNCDDSKENIDKSRCQKSLSRHHSDPVKKLHRSPAFRCDRSEKLKDSRKNSFNSDCSENAPQSFETDRCRLSREKLKRLGHLLEEKMKHDNFEFSKPRNKIQTPKDNEEEDTLLNNIVLNSKPHNVKHAPTKSDDISPQKSLQNIIEQLKPIVYAGATRNNKTDCANNVHEAVNDDLQIPKHILDQYAQVIKPKNRNAFVKKSPNSKMDAVLSDSGVSSESENLISDDLDESEASPKLKNFIAIRNNFETNSNTQGREETANRRKNLRRSSDDKRFSNNMINNNSSKENLINANDSLCAEEVSEGPSFENKIFVNNSKDNVQEIIDNPSSDIGVSDTIKRVLKQPLPAGPPPKKPPRTFVSSQTNGTEICSKSPDQTKTKHKDNKSKYKTRTKEESKLMLEKLENALYKHENGGKILSPRPSRKDNITQSNTSLAWTMQGTKPATAKLKKTHKKVDCPKSPVNTPPVELHYMCTEIFDMNHPEIENINSSDGSLNSAESFRTTNSFTKCFNSLNCTTSSLKHSPGMNYTKLNSSANSYTKSLNNVCCSCSFVSPKDKLRSSRNSIGEVSPPNQTRRLSTFLPSPSKSTENLNNSCNLCEACGSNSTDQFICHINNSNMSNRSFSPHQFIDDSESVIFIDKNYDKKSENSSSHYGVLKKCKSQEHIYAEPFEIRKKLALPSTNQDDENTNSNTLSNDLLASNPFKPPPLIRMRTHLEDGFGKIREVDATKVFNSNTNTQREHLKIFPTNTNEMDSSELSGNSFSSFRSSLRRYSENITTADSQNMETEPNTGSKVKDILMRLETGRASLRLENCKRNDDIRKSLAVRSSVNSNRNVLSSVTLSKNSAININPVKQFTKDAKTNLHYSSTKIYDTPEIEDNNMNEPNVDQHKRQPALAVNKSFLYGSDHSSDRIETELVLRNGLNHKNEKRSNDVSVNVFKRPPLYERKSSTIQSNNLKGRRPHSLYLIDNGKIDQGMFTEPRKRRSPTEVDREHLSRLMTEIYDTVAEACILEGSTATPTSGESEHDTSDEVSLKLTRSLTEKRKRYVRRVTSRVGFLSEDSPRIQKQHSVDERSGDDDPDCESDAAFNAYSTFPSRQSIKNASFLHSNINKDNQMADNSVTSKCSPQNDSVKSDKKEVVSKGGGLFEACILIGMNFSTGNAYIKSIYPEMVVVPPQIESLVFPESVASNMTGEVKVQSSRPMRINDEAPNVQCYTLVLTNEKGLRTYAYCRRVLPEGATHCLPLSYCIISRHRAPSFYYKVLQEIESHHGSSDNIINSVLNQLYSAEFPKPGFSVNIKQIKSPKRLIVNDSSFRKTSPYRNSVNLGDVLKSNSCDAINGLNTPSSSSQSLLVDKDGDKFRRKYSDISTHFPGLNNDLSVMKSLEKIYGENLKEFKSDLMDMMELNKSVSNIPSTEDLIGSKSSNTNLQSSYANSAENFPSESSEGCKNESYQDTDSEEISGDFRNSVRSTGFNMLQIKRPLEPRLDEDNLSVLFESFSVSNLVKIFGTLIIERKVVIVCDKLSQLSSCLEALQSILYPLTWQHTLVSSIPRDMTRDILEAPIPILAGLLLPLSITNSKHQHPELDKIHFEEGMLIDISNGEERLIKVQGDESTLLPPLLSKTLKASLQLGPPITTPSSPSDEHARKTRNVLVAEAFLRFFVEVLGDCKKYFVDSTSPSVSQSGGVYKGKYKFEKEQFIKSFRSKHVQYFLEWFTETAMFNTYIQQRMILMSMEQPSLGKSEYNISTMDLPFPDFYEMFDERVSRRGTSQSARVQLSNAGKEVAISKGNYKMIVNKKVKIWRDKLRDLVS